MINLRGIKARPRDIEVMLGHNPSLVEMHCSVKDYEWNPDSMSKNAQFMCIHDNIGLAVHLPEYDHWNLLDAATEDERLRKMAESVYVQGVGRATSWAPFFAGKTKVVFHPGGISLDVMSEAARRRSLTALDRTIEAMLKAADGKVDILVENMPRHCWFFSGDWMANVALRAAETAEICKRHGIGATLDVCHLYLASQALGFDPVDEIGAVKPYVRHVHYSDARGDSGEGLQLGTGDLPIGKMLGELADLPVVAVPEIWFGHEKHGYAFREAWDLAEIALAASGKKVWQNAVCPGGH
mgnify:CR=1 FL=1